MPFKIRDKNFCLGLYNESLQLEYRISPENNKSRYSSHLFTVNQL